MDAYEGLDLVMNVKAEAAFLRDFWNNQYAARKGSRDDGSRTRRAKARDMGRRQARAAKFTPLAD